MLSNKVLIPVAVALALVIIGLLFLLFAVPAPVEAPAENPDAQEQVATTTEGAAVAPAKPAGLAPEPAFTLPEGATRIDEYSFVKDGKVFFRPVTTGTTSLAIPNSDGDSFKRLSGFMSYPDPAIVSRCGTSGSYAYYGDDKQVYFYQVWRAPAFRSSKIEVIVGADVDDFQVNDYKTAEGGDRIFTVGYEFATTSCSYVLSRADS